MNSGGTLEVTKNGISVSFLLGNENPTIYQRVEGANDSLLGKKVTFSVLYQNKVYSTTFTIPVSGVVGNVGTPFGSIRGQMQKPEMFIVVISITPGTSAIFQAAKLELGSVSTLLYSPPPNPQQELAKCQRYLFTPINPAISGQKYIATGIATAADSIHALMPTPVSMRTLPVALTQIPENTLRAFGRVNGVYVSNIPITALTVYNKMEHGIIVRANSANGFSAGDVYTIYTIDPVNTKILFSAEL